MDGDAALKSNSMPMEGSQNALGVVAGADRGKNMPSGAAIMAAMSCCCEAPVKSGCPKLWSFCMVSLEGSFRSPLWPVGGGVAVCEGSEPSTSPLRIFLEDWSWFDRLGLGSESELAMCSQGTMIELGEDARRREGSTGGRGKLGSGDKWFTWVAI